MAEVELSFTPQPAHVRTARQVAVALARRAGVPDAAMDSVRLAVGETCGLVVALQQASSPEDEVTVVFDDSDGFLVDVRGTTPFEAADGPTAVAMLSGAAEPSSDGLPVGAALAVVTELVPKLEVATSPDGVRLVLAWSTEPGAGE
jgi:serine/threonine-protein kinase RsbW